MGADATSKPAAGKKLCWLASFPKSGNTWTRALLSGLLREMKGERNEKLIELAGSISSNRPRFDEITGLTSADLTDDEVDIVRPDTYRTINRNSSKNLYIKVHDSYHLNLNSVPIFPTDCSIGAIYLVRNPMDVVVSYAHHQGHKDFGRVVKQMNSDKHVLAGSAKAQLRQITLGWSGHFLSWHQQSEIPVLTIRYEDMLEDTYACLIKMASFLNLAPDDLPEKAVLAVEAASFERLQNAEAADGFGERPEKAARFFRSGRAGEGAEVLGKDLQEEIISKNETVMRQLGYL